MGFNEMLGLPASGKSTILKNSSLFPITVDEWSAKKKILYVLKFLASKPLVILYFIFLFIFVRKNCIILYVKGFLRLAVRYEECLKYNYCNEKCLEEGIFQSIWGFAFVLKYMPLSMMLVDKLSHYLIKGLAIDFVVIVDVDIDLWSQIYSRRGKKTRLDYFIRGGNIDRQVLCWFEHVVNMVYINKFKFEKVKNEYKGFNCW